MMKNKTEINQICLFALNFDIFLYNFFGNTILIFLLFGFCFCFLNAINKMKCTDFEGVSQFQTTFFLKCYKYVSYTTL